MRSIPSSSRGLGLRHYFAVALVFVMPAQLLAVETEFSTVRAYMPLVIFSTMAMLIFPKRTMSSGFRYTIFDLTLLMLFVYLAETSIWAQNKDLALVRLLGIILLILTYVNLSSLRLYYSSERLMQLIQVSGVLFVWLSIILYVSGLYLESIDATYFRIVKENVVFHLGVYFEGGVFPRLRGITDSPNNFGAYGLFFLTIFYYLGSRFYACVIGALIILTASFTCILIMALFFLTVTRRKLAALMVFCLSSTVAVMALDSILGPSGHVFLRLRYKLTGGSGRFEIFRHSIEFFEASPFFGAGLNQAREFELEVGRAVQSAHNNILEVMIEGGLLGLALLLICMAATHPRVVGVSKHDSLYGFYVMNLLILLILSLSNATLYNDTTFFVLALLMAVVRRGESRLEPR